MVGLGIGYVFDVLHDFAKHVQILQVLNHTIWSIIYRSDYS